MDIRLALYELAAQHQLDTAAVQKLHQIAGLDREPSRLAYWLLVATRFGRAGGGLGRAWRYFVDRGQLGHAGAIWAL